MPKSVKKNQFDGTENMKSSEIEKFIHHNKELFWFISEKNKKNISDEILVETILNYGDMKETINLIKLLGINKVAEIFFKTVHISERRKGNYQELTVNFFTLLFNKYASRNSNR